MSFFSSTESPVLSRVTLSLQTVKLSNYSSIGLDEVEYDTDANRFYYGNLDVTAFLTTQQRLAFPSYASVGIVRTNEQNYIDKTGDTASGGSTSVVGNFVDGVGSDISSLASGIRKFVAGDPDKPDSMSGLKQLVIVGIIGGLLFLTWKVVTAFKSK